MRAAQISEIVKKTVPEIQDNEVLVRVHAAGFRHSDLQVLQGQFEIGIREIVLACSTSHCAGCNLTRRTTKRLDPRFCDKRETAGFHHDGAFADYMVADPDTIVRLSPSLSMEQAARLMGPWTSERSIDLTNGEGVAATVVCTDAGAANDFALKILRVRGVMGALGLLANGWHFDSSAVVFKEITIRGTYVASRQAPERMMGVLQTAGVRSHATKVPFEGIP
ncbi:alcohol dehydrogenase, putative [Metarhizium acridum CQMa 102]|uniref:Alcohol dehydrogenase, putative n=1 Tax=Metarhizium acridum (strain CQMa 102) TaxID=655827 RepID=E9EHW7_METAQ|nr:alcohol dehydrogenase, putative [Metarhizium acridum CQMa 102]EFY84490.1 alcohol dehydrogenase, putative [Metarhizium acridum CQMa 102]